VKVGRHAVPGWKRKRIATIRKKKSIASGGRKQLAGMRRKLAALGGR
jgi:hypothetical protein